jgi:hypothetical protein
MSPTRESPHTLSEPSSGSTSTAPSPFSQAEVFSKAAGPWLRTWKGLKPNILGLMMC